ncbi:uncharacterized protein LOC129287265 isoform X2 [Prosopis cineraria]|uniref:uncharacterized protein LOC129287265 isoform X2 n=1 Tax=Prosopis cineraria TaxID=364024 RepID=UPI00240EE515|nr:uncharacterized protein LOC129287265 isoform X2 [Prosopis cineraria]
MEGIVHRMVEVNGINMHVAEKGDGPVVLFLHGFPDLWYSWRHQILSLSSRGYRAVAPDLRGYGDTDAPSSISSYMCFHLVGDIVALIDSLGVDQVFLVAHDWGAILGWYLCLFRPERVRVYVCLSVPFRPFLGRNPKVRTVDAFHALYGDDYYICRFQVFISFHLLLLVGREYGTGINPNTPENLPSWLTEEDLAYYVSKFGKTGFTGGLNYYRNLNLDWELTSPWNGVGISDKIPVRFITGDLDLVYTSAGMKEYIHGGGFKKDVPCLEEVFVQKGVAHFNNQEAAEDTSNLIYDFISKF